MKQLVVRAIKEVDFKGKTKFHLVFENYASEDDMGNSVIESTYSINVGEKTAEVVGLMLGEIEIWGVNGRQIIQDSEKIKFTTKSQSKTNI